MAVTSPFRIALANLAIPASPDAALVAMEEAIADAGREGAGIIAFPESFVPGYRTSTRVMPPPSQAFLDEAWERASHAAAAANMAVVLGTERIIDGRPRISVLVVNHDGSTAGFQDKVQLDPSEEGVYAPGTGRRVFTVGALTFGVSICHEGWRYPETVRWAVRAGAQVVFHPHMHEAQAGGFRPTTFGDPRNTFHEHAQRCRAAENTCYFASINCAIDGSPTTSAITGPDGEVIAWQPYGTPGLLIADIDPGLATGYLASRLRELQ